MIIITKSREGHYGYYLSIIKKYFKDAIVVDINNSSLLLTTVFKYARREKFLVLNGDHLLRYRPFILLLMLLLKVEVVQIFYNIDFIFKNNLRSILIKNLFRIQKRLFRKIRNLSLVDHLTNESLGLIHLPDPIDTTSTAPQSGDEKPFILLFGTHGPRKGTYNFLKKYKGDLEIVVVGKIIDQRIHEFKNKERVKIIEGFVSDEVKHEFFSSAKCVAIPYINWYGSSGVLGHAILYDKVIIGPKEFHIGKLLSEYTKSYYRYTGK